MKTKIRFLIISMLFFSCIEKIDLVTTTDFESALVIEATITNELKQQKVVLSRTFRLEEEGPSPESFAMVRIVTENGDFIAFQEEEPGLYLSTSEFAAVPNLEYQLDITTTDGRVYGSTAMQLTNQTQIDDLYLERGLNENGQEGISILVDSFDPAGNSKFYRYTYEETFKIIAPAYNSLDLIVVSHPPGNCPVFAFEIKDQPQLICYRTDKSVEIIIENTNQFVEDRIDNFRVRFINRNNYIMSHRYSILVNQYIQSSEAHEFYKSLKEFSESESLFSQIQPGFLNGNVFSNVDVGEKVIGYFEVSSVDSSRIYFNYEDQFPGEDLPPYYINCGPFAPPACLISGESPVADELMRGTKYFRENSTMEEDEGPYDLVLPPCGNCTVLGSTQPPDFWIE